MIDPVKTTPLQQRRIRMGMAMARAIQRGDVARFSEKLTHFLSLQPDEKARLSLLRKLLVRQRGVDQRLSLITHFLERGVLNSPSQHKDVMFWAIQNSADECIPVLHEAGFLIPGKSSKDRHVFEQTLHAAIANGRWPYVELIKPELWRDALDNHNDAQPFLRRLLADTDIGIATHRTLANIQRVMELPIIWPAQMKKAVTKAMISTATSSGFLFSSQHDAVDIIVYLFKRDFLDHGVMNGLRVAFSEQNNNPMERVITQAQALFERECLEQSTPKAPIPKQRKAARL